MNMLVPRAGPDAAAHDAAKSSSALPRFANLDSVDVRILQRLQLDARISNVDLAKAVRISPSSCHERTKALERAGLINRCIADYDLSRLAHHMTIFLEVTLRAHREADLQLFTSAVAAMPEVTECFMIGGRIDFLLRMVCRDIQHYNQLSARLSREELGVEKCLGHVVLSRTKAFSGYPLNSLLECAS